MSRVRGKIFEGDNTEESLGKMNEFLEKDDVSYVEIMEMSYCRFLLMYKNKRRTKSSSVFDTDE